MNFSASSRLTSEHCQATKQVSHARTKRIQSYMHLCAALASSADMHYSQRRPPHRTRMPLVVSARARHRVCVCVYMRAPTPTHDAQHTDTPTESHSRNGVVSICSFAGTPLLLPRLARELMCDASLLSLWLLCCRADGRKHARAHPCEHRHGAHVDPPLPFSPLFPAYFLCACAGVRAHACSLGRRVKGTDATFSCLPLFRVLTSGAHAPSAVDAGCPCWLSGAVVSGDDAGSMESKARRR